MNYIKIVTKSNPFRSASKMDELHTFIRGIYEAFMKAHLPMKDLCIGIPHNNGGEVKFDLELRDTVVGVMPLKVEVRHEYIIGNPNTNNNLKKEVWGSLIFVEEYPGTYRVLAIFPGRSAKFIEELSTKELRKMNGLLKQLLQSTWWYDNGEVFI